MSHRTQITLTDEQYEFLCRESRRTGLSMSALIRRALSEASGSPDRDDLLAAIRATRGVWASRDDWEDEDGAAYVERIREAFEQRVDRA